MRRSGGVLLLACAPSLGLACACGCGVFDVGTAAMFPQHSGAMAFLEYDFMDQNRNWSGSSQAPASDNSDKRIKTEFFTVGADYRFDRSWGVQLNVPYWSRDFQTTDDQGAPAEFSHGALGDVRIKVNYTGLAADMSTGIDFGLKLPTGDSTYAQFDPDTEIGTGSTDALLGIYHLGNLSSDAQWRYFVQGQWQQPVVHPARYRPGMEFDAVAGAYYEGWSLSSIVNRVPVKLAPMLELNATYRAHDGGLEGDPVNSGYTRLLVTPGMEADFARTTVYVDVGFPVIRNSSGNQLVSSAFYRMNLSFHF